MRQVERAALVARLAHRGQPRPGLPPEPMLAHVERVAAAQGDELARAVAYLHDVVEDTDVTLEDLIGLGVAPVVVEAVALLTHDHGVTLEEYQECIRRLVYARGRAASLARAVKVSDLRDNLDAPERLARAGKPRLASLLAKRYERALETLGAET